MILIEKHKCRQLCLGYSWRQKIILDEVPMENKRHRLGTQPKIEKPTNWFGHINFIAIKALFADSRIGLGFPKSNKITRKQCRQEIHFELLMRFLYHWTPSFLHTDITFLLAYTRSSDCLDHILPDSSLV